MWKDLSMREKAALINIGVKNGLYDLEDIKNSYNKYAEGGPINPYSAGSLVNTIYKNSKKDEYLGEPSHHYDFTISEEEANRLGYYPDKRGHRDDRVKKPAHPTHPSRGKWNSLEEFELTDKGMENPNYTLFGLNDGGQDPQAVMTYKGGVVLPEITVTPKKKYIYNSYDNINVYAKGGDLQGATPRRATPSKQRKSWETDEVGILQNTGDFVKFGYDTLSNRQDSNKYAGGGYKPSSRIKKQISDWEGSSMKTNRSFEAEARDFNASLPKGATSKLTQEQLDGLYSYSYNVGAGNFRKRVNPALTRYLTGRGTIQDVQRSMWASKDSKLRGLAKRRNAERAMLGSYTPMDFGPLSNTTTMMINQYLPSYNEPVEIPQLKFIEIPQLKFNEAFEQPQFPDITEELPTYSESPEIDYNNSANELVGILNMMQMIKKPTKINIHT